MLIVVVQCGTACLSIAGPGSAAPVLIEEAEPVAGVTVAPDPAAEVGRDAPVKTFSTWIMASIRRISRRWAYAASAPQAACKLQIAWLSCMQRIFAD